MKGLKIECEQPIKLGFMRVMGLVKTGRKGLCACFEVSLINRVKTLFLDKLPKPLNQIEIW